MGSESDRIEGIIDELIRVTEGLIKARVSFDTVTEYLMERTEEMDQETRRRVLIFLLLDVIKERSVDG